MAITYSQSAIVKQSARRTIGRVLALIFALSMIMGTGPGVLIVNRPETFMGLPLVYTWGILWYLVLVAVALVAYFALWRSDDEHTASDSSPGANQE
jgi:hypothetical protein